MGLGRRVLLAAGATSLCFATAPGLAAGSAATELERMAVRFEVENVNGSALPCDTDGQRYTIAGQIVGPASILQAGIPSTATLYLHEFSFGTFFWTFDAVPGYDYAADLARRGHVSIAVDRLGYDDSGHPPGRETCLGAHADIAAQIVRQLRQGSYGAEGGSPIAFDRIVLAGHSVGGGVAELAAHSFDDLDIAGLMLFAWADQGYSGRSITQSLRQGQDCSDGGAPAEPGGPSDYAYFGRTAEDFQANVFSDAAPAVVAAASRLRNRDPCGDNATLAQLAAINAVGVGEVAVPVLLLFGEDDAIFEDAAPDVQARLFRGSPGVMLRRFAGAGHALALERAAPEVRAAAAAWLDDHGFRDAPGATASSPRDRHDPRVLSERKEAPALAETGLGWHPLGGAGLLAIAALILRQLRVPGEDGSCGSRSVVP